MNSKFDRLISAEDWCALLGTPRTQLSARSAQRISATESGHRLLQPRERDEHVFHILKRLADHGIVRNTQENIEAFEKGWDENMRLCQERGVSAETLKPKYVKPHTCIRYQRAYVAPRNPYLANDLLGIAAGHYFEKYLADTPDVFEFGCGTGRFLFDLSELFPAKRLVGLDWTVSSQKILGLIAQTGRQVTGLRFDMLEPSPAVRLAPEAGVVTIGAMEQLGDRFQPFLDYLLGNQPAIVVHLEPIDDFYGEDSICDYMAGLYHRQRKYLSGYLTALQALEKQGRIEILESRRLFIGDPYHESSSCLVWKPLAK
jgi:hypothetical protein